MLSAAMSPPVVLTLSDGTAAVSEMARSIAPVLVSAVWPTTCTGAGLSAALMPVCRVPVTITSVEVAEPGADTSAEAVAVASTVASAVASAA